MVYYGLLLRSSNTEQSMNSSNLSLQGQRWVPIYMNETIPYLAKETTAQMGINSETEMDGNNGLM